MAGSRWRGRPSRLRRGALLLALGWTGACAASAEPEISWQARLADGELERAQAAEAQGQRERALELGHRALQRAREAAALGTVGRALLFVGRLEPDLALCLDAVAVFEHDGDHAGVAEAQIATAQALLALGRSNEALECLDHSEVVLAQAGLERLEWARLSAALHHTAGLALGRLGRHDEAQARERQADLALSLLADTEAIPLRIQVELALGADEEARGWPDRAIKHHSRALFLAQRSGDGQAQVEALTGVVTALTSLHHYADAISHCERALDLARDLGDRGRVRDLGRRGLELLSQLGDDSDSAQRRAFEEALLVGS